MEECGFRLSVRPRYAPGRNRTYGLALRRRTLYPLSYRRVGTILPADRPAVGYAGGDAAPRAHLYTRVPGAVRDLALRRHELAGRAGGDRARRRGTRLGSRLDSRARRAAAR